MTPAPAKDLTGSRFGLWTVVERDTSKVYVFWKCRCVCGTLRSVRSMSLTGGGSQSCGCLRGGSGVTHGRSNTPEFTAWQNMKARCYSISCRQFKDYGGRGISVCDEWLQSFEAFFACVGPKPTSEHSLDRIDNNGDYEPGNVRWATRKQQNSNRRIWGIDDKL